jgi:hypothetical protein
MSKLGFSWAHLETPELEREREGEPPSSADNG